MEQLRNSKDGGDATILGRTEPGGGTEEDVYLGQSQDLYSADSGDCGISSSAGFYSGASTYNLGSAQQAKARGTSLGIGQGTHWAWIGEFFQVQGTGSQLCSINVPVSLYGDMSTVQGTAAVRTKLVIKDITENLEYTEIIEDYSIGSTGSKTFSGDSYSPTKDVYLRGGHSYIVYVYIATSVDCGLDWSSAKSDFYGTGLGIVYSRIRLIF